MQSKFTQLATVACVLLSFLLLHPKDIDAQGGITSTMKSEQPQNVSDRSQEKKYVPPYIVDNTHPKVNPSLNDSSVVPKGYLMITLEADSKLFEDPMAYVISIVERPEVLQVKFSQFKTWIIVEDHAAYETWMEKLRTYSIPNLQISTIPVATTSDIEK